MGKVAIQQPNEGLNTTHWRALVYILHIHGYMRVCLKILGPADPKKKTDLFWSEKIGLFREHLGTWNIHCDTQATCKTRHELIQKTRETPSNMHQTFFHFMCGIWRVHSCRQASNCEKSVQGWNKNLRPLRLVVCMHHRFGFDHTGNFKHTLYPMLNGSR